MIGQVIAEADNNGNVTANYIWGLEKVLVKKDTATGGEYYY